MDVPRGENESEERDRVRGVEELEPAECWARLASAELARIALLDPSGDPVVFPVNYSVHDEIVYIRTANDSKLRDLQMHPQVALEADGSEGALQWSVLVRGEARQVTTEEELRRSEAGRILPWSPTPKPYVIRVRPSAITGRRFTRVPGAGASQAHGAVPAADAMPASRATRPQPIPHWPPFSS